MNMADQKSVVDALELVGLEYDDLHFFQNDRITIYQEIEDQEILFLAECGIYTPLKETAILIWDTLGTSVSNDYDEFSLEEDYAETYDYTKEDIEFFVVWIDGKPFAKFVIFPDLERTRYNAISRDRPRTNWTVDRAELLLETGIEVEEVEADTIEQVEEIVVVAVKLHFTGLNDRQAARIFMKDLLGLVDLRSSTKQLSLPRIKESIYA